MLRCVIRWVLSACGLLLISYLFSGIRLDGIGWALITACILGLFNLLIRPLVFLLTLPITILTLGLFTLVINALMLWLTGKLLAGFSVEGFWTALGGAMVMSLISVGANHLVGKRGGMEVVKMHRDREGGWR